MVSFFPFSVIVRMPSLPFPAHLVLLLVSVVAATLAYLFPTLLVGHPYDISPLILARNFAATGLFSMTDALGRFLSDEGIRTLGISSAADGRLSAVIFAQFSRWVAWSNLTGWAVVSALLTALALIPWWFAVRRLADVQTAWIATVVFALLPLTWKQALFLENYHAAVLLLFLSLASFVYLSKRHPCAALLFSGIFFGLSVAAKDVFLIFVPWLVCGYLWEHRMQWKRALVGVLLFAAASGGM
ncbi:glycosyltransferase family 39 protein, partial [Candidatus Peregrinibacteria bacterium]|nr:glycosyltransferase family 39 protein [Candidatus Peregrinibacteria bacterium]